MSAVPIFQRNRKEADDGFTLLELLIVILLIAIFLTLASANWNGPSKKGAEAMAETFRVAVSFLKEEAVSKYEDRVIEFDLTGGKILFGYLEEKTGFTETGEIPLSDGYQLKDVVINGEKFSTGKAYATLSGAGLVDRAIIHLEGDGKYYSLLINPLTAKTTGEYGYIEEQTIK